MDDHANVPDQFDNKQDERPKRERQSCRSRRWARRLLNLHPDRPLANSPIPRDTSARTFPRCCATADN
jgi:hypothetical protein